MDGTKNLMVSRSEKSVWDKPSLSTSLAAYDQERWLMATWGSALAMVGVRRGGFAGGLTAIFGGTLAVRAAMGRHDLHVARRWVDRTLADRGWFAKDVVATPPRSRFRPAIRRPGPPSPARRPSASAAVVRP